MWLGLRLQVTDFPGVFAHSLHNYYYPTLCYVGDNDKTLIDI